ncbi:lycopene cyclase family protein [Demequina pelophila]|uniref:lycopene cyclase family protein n=1 Tax=Demequina pelophila TaxID=1638984 RepID=UPI0007801C13|nr:lycopene cyclase family protein [Demequina pelophila]
MGERGPERVDVAIVGAGAAGLSLAAALARSGWAGSLALVEDGSAPLEDRAWAWWSAGGGPMDDAASGSWSRVRLAGEGWAREGPLAPLAYRAIGGEGLASVADAALARAERAGRVRVRRVRGRALSAVPEGPGGGAQVVIEDPAGARVDLRARWVFDSVGLGRDMGARVGAGSGAGGAAGLAAGQAAAARLDFHGVRVTAPRDVFDRDTVTLMDFRTDQADGVAFVYVLPTSARAALVERTVYAFGASAPSPHRPHLHAYVRDVLGLGAQGSGTWEEAGEERGTIPLHRRPPDVADGPLVPVGARAGLVRASTGYGFARMQRHAEAIAAALAAGRDPAHATSPRRWPGVLDGALLRIVHRNPDGARDVFGALWRRNPPARVLRFLEEQASPREQALVIASLPGFVPAAWRAAVAARRRTL